MVFADSNSSLVFACWESSQHWNIFSFWASVDQKVFRIQC